MTPESQLVTVQEIAALGKWSLNGGPFGSKLVSKDYVPEGVPVIRGINLPFDSRFSEDEYVYVSPEKAESLIAHSARRGDVVFTQRGTLGQVGLIPPDSKHSLYIISQSQMKLTVNTKRADPRWIYYYFRQPAVIEQLVGLQSSSGVPHINLATLREYKLPLPPLPTQRKIAAILSAYDDLLENNTRRVQVLEQMARALYREWFVEYRFPGHEQAEWVEDEGGRKPQGWERAKVGDKIELAYGKALKADQREPGPYPVYGSGGVVGYHSSAMVKGPGIIVGRKGNVGAVYWSADDFFPIDTVYFVRSVLPLPYLFFNLQDQNFINNDAAVPGLNRNQAYSLPLLVPDKNTLDKFAAIVGTIFEQLTNLSQRNANLRRTRDLLLPRLVSGELDVSGLRVLGPGLEGGEE